VPVDHETQGHLRFRVELPGVADLANVVAGVLVGLAGYWALRRVLTSWLYEMTPEDPRVFAAAVVVLALVAAVASWIPTRRATRVDPATALRLD
jgi:ABC-type antimicrobial peptide transport system permease subunit